MTTQFIRMNGLGNDFLIYDARNHLEKKFSADEIVKLCSRENKITGGCDQLIIIENSDKATAKMLVYNADSSEVFACGNATRCVVNLIYKQSGLKNVSVETKATILKGVAVEDELVSVDMGQPIFDWKKIPLSHDVDIENLPIEIEGFNKPFAVSMGNPHMVFTTDKKVLDIDVKKLGAKLEFHSLFPERANVGFAEIVDKQNINLRVFERGSGETLACGTGACAAAVAAISRGLVFRKVNIKALGGTMQIEWQESDGHVIMTGSVKYEGEIIA
jgi:diaminopimelate epimerase